MGQFDHISISVRPKNVTQRSVSPSRRRLRRLALHWDSLMRNRSRWIEDDVLSASIAQRSREHLQAMGIEEAFLAGMALAELVEVSQSFGGVPSSDDWDTRAEQDMRRMPWESMLTMSAKKFQIHEKLLIIRHIQGLPASPALIPGAPLTALFIESAPGKLQTAYDFDAEYRAVQTYLEGLTTINRLRHPSLERLRQEVRQTKPAIIHLSGIDGYQGFQLLKQEEGEGVRATVPSKPGQKPPRPQEGVYFRDELGEPVVVDPETVADALTPDGHSPLLVTFNLYNSSARLAAGTVIKGARAALGFQDYTDDTVAEIFFANLFSKWSHNRPSPPLLEAFEYAVRELDHYSGKVRGSGVTLWTRESLLDKPSAIVLHTKKAAKAVRTKTRGKVDLDFAIEPLAELNYSVLHNGRRQMFDIFRIYKFTPGPLEDVRVEVVLQIGAENFTFRGTFEMDHHILDLTERIKVGLTSSLSRSLRESVRTTVFVRVLLGDHERYCDTANVSLLAVDEWKDDKESGIFLPSFVLPRDPLVAQVIARAQRYLMALADDFVQGFDGYQSCEDYPDDPATALEVQVRSIWYALQHDFALNYINPPPTFSEYSQRLRTPTDVMKGGRGTCIDLALILAACLEYIGLHPVLFLLSGHAFVGYWNDENRRDDFLTTKDEPLLSTPEEATPLPTDQEQWEVEIVLPRVEWQFDERRRKQIVDAVERGHLVALEATYLANGGSFADACEVGASNLDNEQEFESMIEITLAREKNVTPLPLCIEEEAR